MQNRKTTCLICGQHFVDKKRVCEHIENKHRTRANTRFKSIRRGLHWENSE